VCKLRPFRLKKLHYTFIHLIDEGKHKNTPADADATGDYTRRKITSLIGIVMEMNNSFI